jgi:hypothetical protein
LGRLNLGDPWRDVAALETGLADFDLARSPVNERALAAVDVRLRYMLRAELAEGSAEHEGGEIRTRGWDAAFREAPSQDMYVWAEQHSLSGPPLCRVLAHLARALEAVHAQAAVHRDVGSKLHLRVHSIQLGWGSPSRSDPGVVPVAEGHQVFDRRSSRRNQAMKRTRTLAGSLAPSWKGLVKEGTSPAKQGPFQPAAAEARGWTSALASQGQPRLSLGRPRRVALRRERAGRARMPDRSSRRRATSGQAGACSPGKRRSRKPPEDRIGRARQQC